MKSIECRSAYREINCDHPSSRLAQRRWYRVKKLARAAAAVEVSS